VSKDLVKEMIKVAQPVLTWLKEADEATDDDEEDDEEVVNFDDRAGANRVTNEKPAEAKKIDDDAPKEDESEEELNIDDI
jgi:hypothetical protein